MHFNLCALHCPTQLVEAEDCCRDLLIEQLGELDLLKVGLSETNGIFYV
jgi:hypothetical protein